MAADGFVHETAAGLVTFQILDLEMLSLNPNVDSLLADSTQYPQVRYSLTTVKVILAFHPFGDNKSSNSHNSLRCIKGGKYSLSSERHNCVILSSITQDFIE